jgi:hypothetical protein
MNARCETESGRTRVLTALMVLCLAGVASAQQQQFGQPGTYVAWGGPPPNASPVDVTYFIGGGFTANETTLIRQAATAWANASGGIRVLEVGSAGAAGMTVTFNNGGGFGTTTLTTTVGGGTYPNGLPWRQITAANVNLNGSLNWWDGTGAIGPGERDFQAAILDLFGRGLGLGTAAAGDGTSVMQANITPNIVGNHVLSATDVAAVNAVYGSPEPATFALFAVGLALLLARLLRAPASTL